MTSETTETVDQFRARAREWLSANMRPIAELDQRAMHGEDAHVRARELQRKLYDAGFAGIRWPAEYGGLGLDIAYQRAFTKESLEYEMPTMFNVPTFGILAATLIDFGSHEQKVRHLPAILRGEELWVQFLSEPTGGSDLAGCLTRADRDGDQFILSGSKIWSSSAHVSDYAMCLARTNWDAPKHRGLTMFIVKIHQPGIQIDQIKQVNGSMEFCQEFFDDVPMSVDDVVGDIDDGWAVATRLLLHERTAVGGGSPYTSGRSVGGGTSGPDLDLVELAAQTGRSAETRTRQLVAANHVEHLVNTAMVDRVSVGLQSGKMPPPSGSLLKLFHAELGVKKAEAAVEIAGSDAVVWPANGGMAKQMGNAFLDRQAMCLGGGSNEIQRNIISERVLGMPREWAADRDVAYRDVKRNAMPEGPR